LLQKEFTALQLFNVEPSVNEVDIKVKLITESKEYKELTAE
jgi:hypothetical protein